MLVNNESDMENSGICKFYALSADLFIPCSYLAVPVQLVEVIHTGGHIIPHKLPNSQRIITSLLNCPWDETKGYLQLCVCVCVHVSTGVIHWYYVNTVI